MDKYWRDEYYDSTESKKFDSPQPVTTKYSGLTTATDIIDAANYKPYRRANWINRSKYVIYMVLVIFAIIIISHSPGGWKGYYNNFRDSLGSQILNVFSFLFIIDLMSSWFIDLTVMRGVEYTFSERYMAGEWLPEKRFSTDSDTVTELRNTGKGLREYGRFTYPTLE